MTWDLRRHGRGAIIRGSQWTHSSARLERLPHMQEVPGSSPGASTNLFSRPRKGFSGFPTQLSAARWIVTGQSAGQSIGWTADDVGQRPAPKRRNCEAQEVVRSNPSAATIAFRKRREGLRKGE